MTSLVDIAIGSPCGYCKAGIGDACIARPSRTRARYVHEDRVAPIRYAFNEGYDEGESNVLSAFIEHRPYFNRMLARHTDSHN